MVLLPTWISQATESIAHYFSEHRLRDGACLRQNTMAKSWCQFSHGGNANNTPGTLEFGTALTTDSLAIPQDALVGIVIYEDSLQDEELIFECHFSFFYRMFMTPALGVPSDKTYPLGKTKLSFRIKPPP